MEENECKYSVEKSKCLTVGVNTGASLKDTFRNTFEGINNLWTNVYRKAEDYSLGKSRTYKKEPVYPIRKIQDESFRIALKTKNQWTGIKEELEGSCCIAERPLNIIHQEVLDINKLAKDIAIQKIRLRF